MFKKIKSMFFLATIVLLIGMVGCKKITTDLNINPNVPSSVDSKYILSSALKSSASITTGGNNDLINIYMGYWSVSGGYIPNAGLLQYKVNTDFGAGIWDETYITLANYQSIINGYGTDAAKGAKYIAIANIMKAFHYQKLVDVYNNIPYSEALNAGTNNAPAYDDALTIYKSLVNQIDSSVALISTASISADDPGSYDIMYGGTMSKWVIFAKTLKLKILVHLSKTAGGPAYIQSKLAGLKSTDFIGANADATINPGYTNSAGNQQNPMWADIGYTPTGGLYGNGDYYRANTYAMNFYKNTNDPRKSLFYAPSTDTLNPYRGRIFGSTIGTEVNAVISAVGGNSTGNVQTAGLLKSPTQGAIILSSTESFFLQAEAMQMGFLTDGNAGVAYQAAVAESFRMLGTVKYDSVATSYTSQANDNVNFSTSANKIKTIILQKWAALNTYDPLESWSDWRRLGIPSDLPISIYPGVTAPHIPYRLLYPTSEFSFNTANVNKQGTIDAITSKIFWMP